MKIQVWAPGFRQIDGGIQAFSRAFVLAAKDVCDVSAVSRNDRTSCLPIPTWCAGKAPAAGRVAWFCAKAFTACLVKRPDVILATHRNFARLAVAFRKLFKVRIAVVMHGIEAWVPGHIPSIQACDHLIAVTQFTANRVQNWLGKEHSIQILPNTVDEERFLPGPKPIEFLKKFDLKPKDKILLTVGRMDAQEAYKGQDAVIRALPLIQRAYPKCKYLLVGDGSDRERLKNIAREVGVERDVIFAGRADPADLPLIYRLCDVFIMPSRGEGFGIVYLEALSCGKPVIAGNSDASSEALLYGKLGRLVSPDNWEEIAHSATEALAGGLPHGVREEMLAHYGKQAFCRRVKEILEGWI